MKKLLPRSPQTLPHSPKVVSVAFGTPTNPIVMDLPQKDGSTYAAPPEVVSPTTSTPRKWRIALYSHDTMGLGHKRRNLLIAQALGYSTLPADILMISGMNDASNGSMPPGVDYLTLPALYKGIDGQYQPRRWDISLKEIIALRSQVIRATIATFKPDVLIVDNVPRGAVRELDPTLEYLREHGTTRCILGLRDILDDPAIVRRDWERAANDEAIRKYYDAVWIYGDPSVYDITRECRFAPDVAAKFHHIGYLDQRFRLKFADESATIANIALPPGRLAVCMVGGGQDGARLAEAFARSERPPDTNGVILTGPLMPAKLRQRLQGYAAQSSRLTVLDYLAEPTLLLEQADWVVSMGGYNTICEILSFEKRALIVPRIKPRREQLIRAERLQQLGIVDVLHPDRLSPIAISDWFAQSWASPLIRDRLDLNGLNRLPQLLEATLTTDHYSTQHAS
ncbi:glycosyltransferase family protein [Oculatella sp. LEGE 06141]|uniref:glycosyltransferase family protein n=1 Tax=Oculatella sp. LEGE 06141 TaxID=1828648 RepID=UPI001D154143|nr:glycosyltransferase [Oculatella sp. LEGE 06141]